ncbi:NmrA family NAD(P)-binding protein [Kitasatospora sp. NPDC004240]
MEILVAGATGVVGRQVAAQLAGRGAGVRALSRRAVPNRPGGAGEPGDSDGAAGPSGSAGADGIRAVRGDLRDPASLAAAADGAEAAFLVWPLPAEGAAEAVAVLSARVPRIVFLSSGAVRDVPGRGPESPGRAEGGIEALIERSGVRHTFLRPGGFMANTLRWADELRRTGAVRGFGGAAGLSLIDERDIAAVAVRALLEDGHDGARYALTGPAPVTQIEQVRLIGETVGRPYRWEEIPRAEAHAGFLASGWPPAIIAGALDHLATSSGSPEPVTDVVATVTGAPARPLGAWLADHADRFR